MSRRHHISSIPFRLVVAGTLSAAALTVLLIAAPPAAMAGPSHCDTTLEAINDWSTPEESRILSVAELRHLRTLISILEDCRGGPPVLETLVAGDKAPYRGMGSNAEQWTDLVSHYFDAGDVDRVICLIAKESGGNPDALNPKTGASGLMQVMPFWAEAASIDSERLFEPQVNLWLARSILEIQGWSAWSPYRRGACR